MSKNRVLIFIIILVVVGAYIIIKQQQSINQVDHMEQQALDTARQTEINKAKQIVAEAEKVKQQAVEAARKAEAEAEKAKQQAIEEAKRVEALAQKKAEELKAKMAGLVTQAQALLDSGQLQQAIDLAKSILGEDPNNTAAKSIMEQATAKLKEAAGNVQEAVAEKLQGAGAGLPNVAQ